MHSRPVEVFTMALLIWIPLVAAIAGFLWFCVWLMRRTGNA
jgi:hypothetical protein